MVGHVAFSEQLCSRELFHVDKTRRSLGLWGLCSPNDLPKAHLGAQTVAGGAP